MSTYIPNTVEISGHYPDHKTPITIPVIVMDSSAESAPLFGSIARSAGLGGRDTEPIWTVIWTGHDGTEHRQARDKLSRYNHFAATNFASELSFNGMEVQRFEVERFV